LRKRGITTFLIGVVLIPYWSKLLNVKNQGETGGVGAFLDAGDLWRLDRVNVRVKTTFLDLERPDVTRCSQLTIDEANRYLQVLFSRECSRGEVQPLVEGQAAHEPQLPDEERSRGEP